MKRVKLMLLSLTLLAVVGGALAFNAKFTQRFCTTSLTSIGADNGNLTSCPVLQTSIKVDPTGVSYYTTTLDNDLIKDCKIAGQFVPCFNSVEIAGD